MPTRNLAISIEISKHFANDETVDVCLLLIIIILFGVMIEETQNSHTDRSRK